MLVKKKNLYILNQLIYLTVFGWAQRVQRHPYVCMYIILLYVIAIVIVILQFHAQFKYYNSIWFSYLFVLYNFTSHNIWMNLCNFISSIRIIQFNDSLIFFFLFLLSPFLMKKLIRYISLNFSMKKNLKKYFWTYSIDYFTTLFVIHSLNTYVLFSYLIASFSFLYNKRLHKLKYN